ncbi:MAG: pilus assembly protein PilM [Piscirickettsiaceae bacterium]|nr:pilus assembly protein PilM [Piscirickettsiaceae bacterium]
MQLLKSIFKKKAVGVVALSFTSEGVAVAISTYEANNELLLIHCEFIYSNKKLDTLKALVRTHNLDQYDCHIVLATEDYRLISLESPMAEDSEMLSAIRWKIADFIDSPDDVFLDYYSMPISKRANSVDMIEVVAAPKSSVQGLIDLCQHCELHITNIDIQEMALRNLSTLLPDSQRGVVLLHLQKNSGHMLITHNNIIHLNRKIASGFDRLNDNGPLGGSQLQIEQNSLALEIQRSTDHVSSAFSLSNNTEITVIPTPNDTQSILNFLSIEHGITARIMDLSTIVNSNIILSDTTQAMCAPVIGATIPYDVNIDAL